MAPRSLITPALAARVGVATAAILAASVAAWEGRRHTAYDDLGGVKTVCDGITGPDVIPGHVYSDSECDALLDKHLSRHVDAVRNCIHIPLAPSQLAAWAHFSFNVGDEAFCKSTAAKLLNEGRGHEACEQLLRWTFVAGKDCADPRNGCIGLLKRRQAERSLCLRPDFGNVRHSP